MRRTLSMTGAPVSQLDMTSYAHKKQQLYLVLSGIFLVNALLAEIIGVKIFSVEKKGHAERSGVEASLPLRC